MLRCCVLCCLGAGLTGLWTVELWSCGGSSTQHAARTKEKRKER